MTFSVEKAALCDALGLIASCLSSTRPQAILQCVLFQGSGLSVKAIATDIDTTVTTEFFSVVDEDFSFCVPYRQLLTLAKLLKEDVVFQLEAGHLIVKSKGSRHRLPLYRKEEFPEVVEPSEGYEVVTVPSHLLHEMISCGQIAASKENTGSWMLTCVNLRIKEERLLVASSNGRHMALASTPAKPKRPMEVLIPMPSVAAFLKVTDCKGDSVIFADKHSVKVVSDRGVVSSRLMEGRFPDLERVIPQQFQKKYRIQGKEFELLCKRASLSSGPKRDVWCTFSDGEVLMQSEDPIKGKSEETMTLLGSDTEELTEVGFHCDRVEDCLSRFPGEFTIEVSEKMPVRFVPLECDFDFQYLVMPLRKVAGEEPTTKGR